MRLRRRGHTHVTHVEASLQAGLPILNLALFALWLLFPAGILAQTPVDARQDTAPITRDEIARAIEEVKADPNLNAQRTIRWLRWVPEDEQPQPSAWSQWILGLFRWIGQTARVVVWVVAALVAGLLALWLIRLLRAAGEGAGEAAFEAPTHVRDLDIRPESLPADIGATARSLWDRGEHRPALALLYRGLLSRLAHVHRVPIRDATTEGDCLVLAAAHLTAERHDYVRRLVRAWQHGVYGGELVETATVHELCDRFGSALDRAEPSEPAALRAAGAHA